MREYGRICVSKYFAFYFSFSRLCHPLSRPPTAQAICFQTGAHFQLSFPTCHYHAAICLCHAYELGNESKDYPKYYRRPYLGLFFLILLLVSHAEGSFMNLQLSLVVIAIPTSCLGLGSALLSILPLASGNDSAHLQPSHLPKYEYILVIQGNSALLFVPLTLTQRCVWCCCCFVVLVVFELKAASAWFTSRWKLASNGCCWFSTCRCCYHSYICCTCS